MASWKIHIKHCKKLGIKEEICRKVTRIIDSPPHDIEDMVLRKLWLRDAFESGNLFENPIAKLFIGKDPLINELAEILRKFGRDGIIATFNHIALDRIAELIEQGFNKEEIRAKLLELDLMKYIADFDEAFSDISKEVKPSKKKISQREEFTEIVRYGVRGIFMIDDKFLPAPSALLKIKSKLKRGEIVRVRYGRNHRSCNKTIVFRDLKDFEEFLKNWIKYYH